jgi:uncharacterized protein
VSDESPLLPLHTRVTWLWRLQGLLRLAMFWGPLAVGGGIGLGMVTTPAAGAVLSVALIAFFSLFALVWPSLEYEHFRYAVREHDLLVQRGVLFRRRSSIPHNRIQHVDTRQGPIERVFGLSSLAVYTASGISADGSIPGLATKNAEGLRDELARLGGDDGV